MQGAKKMARPLLSLSLASALASRLLHVLRRAFALVNTTTQNATYNQNLASYKRQDFGYLGANELVLLLLVASSIY
jgi:hypothetical protein